MNRLRKPRLTLLVASIMCAATVIAGGQAERVYAGAAVSQETHGTLEYQRGIIQSADNGMCLDSNHNGDVYVLPCTANNKLPALGHLEWRVDRERGDRTLPHGRQAQPD